VVQLVPQSQAGDCTAYVLQFTCTTAHSTQQGHEYLCQVLTTFVALICMAAMLLCHIYNREHARMQCMPHIQSGICASCSFA